MEGQQYILRYYLPVKPYFDEEYTKKRFEELLAFCKETSTDAVMFYVALNPDWYYMPDTVAYAKECRDYMLPYIERLRKAGISYQLNFQNIMGATLGGVDFSKDYGWENLVDHRGRECKGCGCPIGKKFRAHAGERLRIWAETNPDVIWIDDDLRYHNHGTPVFAKLEGEGEYLDHYCFCNNHIQRFNQLHGTSYDRESLVKEISKPGIPSPIRKAYLNFLGDTMTETAAWIRKTVQDISPNTRLAQMVNTPDDHAAEGRDWNQFLPALSGKYAPMIRPQIGPYKEGMPKDYFKCYKLVAQTMAQIREGYSGKVEYCPEIENTRFTTWSKSAKATSYQLALSAFMGCDKITLSLYDLEGGAFSDEPLYGEMLKQDKAFLDKLVSLKLGDAKGIGVVIPTSGNSGCDYRIRTGEDYEAISGQGHYIENYLLNAGIPCTYLAPHEINQEHIVALDSYSAGYLSDEVLHKILCGKVFMDGDAADILCQRGFSKLLGICNLEKQHIYVNTEVIKMFCREDGTYIRIPSRIPFSCWYKEELEESAEILTEFLTPDGKHHKGLYCYKNECGGSVAVYPASRNWGDGFYTHYRIALFKELFARLSDKLPRIDCHSYAFVAVKEKENGERYYFVGNLATDKMKTIKINGKEKTCDLEVFEVAVFMEKDGQLNRI